jgi:L-seryl-tRNA(Ser) seleniumtransferase
VSDHPPSVDAVLRSGPLAPLRGLVPHDVLVTVTRDAILRDRLGNRNASAHDIGSEVTATFDAMTARSSARVINATGTILHTNLGRAPLSHRAAQAMMDATGYSALEVDPISGRRESRQQHVEPLLRALLACEAACVVVNNAAAVLLMLRVLAARRSVVVSRGQLVEIGDGFRLPTIIAESGARLIEVGTTNRTLVDDYVSHVTPNTKAFLHIHPSNFSQVGFVESPTLSELADAAHDKGLLLLSDNGSGPMVDTREFGLAHEPTPREAIEAGADVVAFSTDKLLGGPQGGVIAGSKDIVDRIRRHPLARALRPDKLALAALRATLAQYLSSEWHDIPVLKMMNVTPESLAERATSIRNTLVRAGLAVTIDPCKSTVGGGSLPGQSLPSWAVVLSAASPTRAASRMRTANPAIHCRMAENKMWFDLRTVSADDDHDLVSGIVANT